MAKHSTQLLSFDLARYTLTREHRFRKGSQILHDWPPRGRVKASSTYSSVSGAPSMGHDFRIPPGALVNPGWPGVYKKVFSSPPAPHPRRQTDVQTTAHRLSLCRIPLTTLDPPIRFQWRSLLPLSHLGFCLGSSWATPRRTPEGLTAIWMTPSTVVAPDFSLPSLTT